MLLETAADLVYRVIPDPDVDTMAQALREAVPMAHQLGLTGIHDPGSPIVLAALKVLHERKELDLRALVHIPADGLDAAIRLGLRSGLGNEYLRIGGLKVFADGALGPQSAHMLASYEGSEQDTGLATLSRSELYEIVERSQSAGLSVAVHAIGDAANRVVLDAIAGSLARYPPSRSDGLASAPFLPHRIEHVQLLHPQDVPRLAQLGVVASMQPIHATSDMEIAERHWGRRCDLSYAWRSVLESGAVLAFGSDCPVETLDPLAGIHAAVTRRGPHGEPGPKGWIPEQRLTVTEAVHAYTIGAAQATREANIKGSLRSGMLADLVVLSHDIFVVDPMEILGTAVELTVFDGRIVYTKITT